MIGILSDFQLLYVASLSQQLVQVTEFTTKLSKGFVLLNQSTDILFWSWILLIMIKRVVCNTNESRKLSKLSDNKFSFITHHYISDVMILIASIIALIQFSNQFYYYTIGHIAGHPIMSRTIPWMIFHKIIEISLLIKYKNSQPKLFIDIAEEIEDWYKSKFKKTI